MPAVVSRLAPVLLHPRIIAACKDFSPTASFSKRAKRASRGSPRGSRGGPLRALLVGRGGTPRRINQRGHRGPLGLRALARAVLLLSSGIPAMADNRPSPLKVEITAPAAG